MPKTVLAVDDAQSLQFYNSALRNYTFWGTTSPHKALSMAQNRAPHLLLTAVDFLYTDFSLDGKDLIKRMDEIDSETKKVLCSVNSEHSVRGILDDLRSQGIEVFYIRFADVPNNLAALVRSLVGE